MYIDIIFCRFVITDTHSFQILDRLDQKRLNQLIIKIGQIILHNLINRVFMHQVYASHILYK